MIKRKNNVIKSFFLAHINIYIFLIGLFLIGLVTGIIHANLLDEGVKAESYTYISTFINTLKTKQCDVNIMWTEFLISNLKPAIFLWILGLCVIGIPLVCVYIAFEGYSFGFVISTVLSSIGVKKGWLILALSMIPQELIIIPMLLTLGVNSILFANAIWKYKSRIINIKFDIYRYIFIFIFCIFVLILATLFQTYIGVPVIKGVLT